MSLEIHFHSHAREPSDPETAGIFSLIAANDQGTSKQELIHSQMESEIWSLGWR